MISTICVAGGKKHFAVGDTVDVIFMGPVECGDSVISAERGVIVYASLGFTNGPDMILTGLYHIEVSGRVYMTSPYKSYDMVGFGSYTIPEKGMVMMYQPKNVQTSLLWYLDK